jgi:hypothetical protein
MSGTGLIVPDVPPATGEWRSGTALRCVRRRMVIHCLVRMPRHSGSVCFLVGLAAVLVSACQSSSGDASCVSPSLAVAPSSAAPDTEVQLTGSGLVYCQIGPSSLPSVVVFERQDAASPSPVVTAVPHNGNIVVSIPVPKGTSRTIVFSVAAVSSFPGATSLPVTIAR